MKPVRRRWRASRAGLIAVLVTALTMQAGGQAAEAAPSSPNVVVGDKLSPRNQVFLIWQDAGSQVKAAAERALTGSDADVDAFLRDNVDRLAALDDRISVDQLLAAGGPATKAAAQQALDAADTDPKALRTFLDAGWVTSSTTDLRVRVDQILAAGGPQVQKAAQAALADGSSDALHEFLNTTAQKAEAVDLRVRVNQVLAVGGPEVQAAAQTALGDGSPNALRLFLDREWEVAAARDQETDSIQHLLGQAKIAGEQAAQKTQAAKDEAVRAQTEADKARQAADLAAKAAEAAKDNAAGAADAAGRAATAADRAAGAAQTALGAANAATSAARIAAQAASRAAAAASKAGNASAAAWSAAAQARTDKGKAHEASEAAKTASAASIDAKQAQDAIDGARVALGHARDAVDAATSASQNADKSAEAARTAVRWAQSAGADAHQAEAAAAKAAREAARANRAAAAARAFADEADAAAAQARELAGRAATDAMIAAAAADEAALHAGEADHAAEKATENANAATAAAQTATDAAAQAKRIFDAARKVDDERLAVQSDQATQAAQQALDIHDQLGLTRKWNAAQEEQRDAETNRLLAEAAAPGTDPALALSDGRKAALRLFAVGGPWTKSAAQAALSGADREVLEFVGSGVARAAGQDNREALQELADTSVPAKKAAAEKALAGSDEDVKKFLAAPDYPGEDTDFRIQVDQALAAARNAGDAVVAGDAEKALAAGTVEAYRKFLDTGRNLAQEKDDRIALNQLIANSGTGPETRALAQAALAGSPDIVRQYRFTGQYLAARHDREAAAHNAVVAGLVSEATSIAAKAAANAADAQAAAATARGAAKEADAYAAQAKGYANDAVTSAKQAIQSAADAQDSAKRANESAAQAAAAAKQASQAAVRASQSAVLARHSANVATQYAQSAINAAHQAYQDAIDAGKDANDAVAAANNARDKAIAKANQEIAAAKKKFSDDVNNACNAVPAGSDHDDCVARAARLVNDPKGESERNVAVCNQLKQYSEQTFNDCLKGAYNPALTYLINKAISDAKQKAEDQEDSDRWWSIAGTIVAGAIVIGAGVFCAEVCTAPLVGALASTEVGFLAEAAGAGIELTIGAEFLSGVASDSLLASRLSALSSEEFLSDVAVRNGLSGLARNFARQISECIRRFAVAATGPGACPSLILQEIHYDRWGDTMGDLGYVYRRTVSGETMNPGINVAVARLPGWKDPKFGDEYIRAFSGDGKHSEIRILDDMEDQIAKMKAANPGNEEIQGLSLKKITDFFTERSPCPSCASALATRLDPNLVVVRYAVAYYGESGMERELLASLIELRKLGAR